MSSITQLVTSLPLFWAAVLASLIAGLAAGVGALPVLVVNRASRRLQDVLLGTAAGIMLAATCFSLLLPGLQIAAVQTSSVLGGALLVGIGIMAGAVGLWLMHRCVPHEHIVKGKESLGGGMLSPQRVRRIWLFVLAITLHNIPEGLAVGVGVASGDSVAGMAVTLGIFLQNLPEGFVVALAMLPLGWSRLQAILLALATGAVETVGGLIGAGAVTLSAAVLPWALAGAAGAMLFVISHEIIPETHENGHETPATFGIVGGFVVMMLLDVALGTTA
ncbi:MAG: ZIP family metal transporter [Rhodospirillales bacterium]